MLNKARLLFSQGAASTTARDLSMAPNDLLLDMAINLVAWSKGTYVFKDTKIRFCLIVSLFLFRVVYINKNLCSYVEIWMQYIFLYLYKFYHLLCFLLASASASEQRARICDGLKVLSTSPEVLIVLISMGTLYGIVHKIIRTRIKCLKMYDLFVLFQYQVKSEVLQSVISLG